MKARVVNNVTQINEVSGEFMYDQAELVFLDNVEVESNKKALVPNGDRAVITIKSEGNRLPIKPGDIVDITIKS